MRDVYVVGVGMTRFGKHLDRSIKNLTCEAVTEALSDAGLSLRDIQAAWFANTSWGILEDQHGVRGHVALGAMDLLAVPIFNVEGACGGGAMALHSAWLGVASGVYECALAVGAEKLYHEDKAKSFRAIATGTDIARADAMFSKWRDHLKGIGIEISDDEKNGSGASRSPMMDMYSYMIRWHMKEFGSTQYQLAAIAAKNHWHSSFNPKAQYQNAMTAEEVLAGRPVVYPLTVPMCAPVGDGSAAAILCSGNFLKRLKSPRPVKVLASIFGSNTDAPFDSVDAGIAVRLSEQAYERAGLGPEDIDVAEVHDATSYGELKMSENLGFCARGEGGHLAESGETKLGGRIPINPSGGLESRGHPLGASGLAQVQELITQLRGEAGQRQVDNATLALAENGGGMIHFEEASMGIHIFEKV